ncbi:MAG: hypothetical protein VZQ55_06495 [Ruminococcus sp.]|jgi:hypothetical protein|nr:hypothetical protein [Ruminococcus sp.]
MYYPIVRAELARQKKTLADLVLNPKVACTVSTLSLKLNNKAPLTLREAKGIKEELKSTLPLDVLFEEDKEE